MNISEYAKYDGLGLAELVKQKEVKPEELLNLSVEAIRKVNPELNSIISVLKEEGLKEINKGLPEGPFTGVPFLIKEMALHAEGIPSSMGSRLSEGMVYPLDSELMRRFRKAGFVTVGTTTTPEFAYSAATESVLHGATRNPWNINHSPGGSSGGASASVSAGITPIAHANDGGGSIRIPAACTGLVGLKPTRGRTPTGPLMGDVMNGRGVEFAVTRTIRDTAYLLDEVQGPEPGCYSYVERPKISYKEIIKKPVRPLTIAFTTEAASGVDVDEENKVALRETVQLLEDLGHNVVEAAPTYDSEMLTRSTVTIWTANIYNMAQGVAEALDRTPSPDNLEAAIWQCYLHGKELSANDLLTALDDNNTISRDVGQFFTNYDVFLSPTIGTLPAKIGFLNANNPNLSAREWTEQIFDYAPFTNIFNATGQPSISLPLKMSKTGLPIGMQFTSNFADEATLLQLAKQLEDALPWNNRKPTIHV